MIADPAEISSIVFDLDGTLYVCPPIGREIQAAADGLVAATRGLSREGGAALLRRARQRLEEALGEEPTLTRTCQELGIDLFELHQAFQDHVHPEQYLASDPVLAALLESLEDRCTLYIYTNNNLPLTRKILALLGVEASFSRLFTIEFCGQPKPDRQAFRRVVEEIGGPAHSFLFVGDRDGVDLGLARENGMSTLLVKEAADLLQIHRMLGIIP